VGGFPQVEGIIYIHINGTKTSKEDHAFYLSIEQEWQRRPRFIFIHGK
jgi:DUF1680 family protein